ncbi:DnaJ family domain-containing protein [Kribbella sp. NPDC054772]
MTKRRPPGMSNQEWVESQIKLAQNQGEFENLPGAGKPLKLADQHDPDWWVKDFIRREDVETEALLPPAVQLRKEKEHVHEKVRGMRRESEVREYLSDLNKRIRVSIRDTTGPVVPTGPVNEEVVIAQWRMDRPAREPRAQQSEQHRPARKKSIWQRLFS